VLIHSLRILPFFFLFLRKANLMFFLFSFARYLYVFFLFLKVDMNRSPGHDKEL